MRSFIIIMNIVRLALVVIINKWVGLEISAEKTKCEYCHCLVIRIRAFIT
jgi:hypothetical protein